MPRRQDLLLDKCFISEKEKCIISEKVRRSIYVYTRFVCRDKAKMPWQNIAKSIKFPREFETRRFCKYNKAVTTSVGQTK